MWFGALGMVRKRLGTRGRTHLNEADRLHYGGNGGILELIMPSIAELATNKIMDAYGSDKPITIAEAVRSVGGSESYATNGKLTRTKTYLARLPELNAIATARKIKLEALADKYARKKAKDAKFSELASASASYRKDIQTMTGGATENINVNSVTIKLRK